MSGRIWYTFLLSMELAKSKLGLRRWNVENGRAGEHDKHKKYLCSRHSELLLMCYREGISFFYAD